MENLEQVVQQPAEEVVEVLNEVVEEVTELGEQETAPVEVGEL
jgi:tRNA(Ile2) C34 agmatinyltransferase TiaS